MKNTLLILLSLSALLTPMTGSARPRGQIVAIDNLNLTLFGRYMDHHTIGLQVVTRLLKRSMSGTDSESVHSLQRHRNPLLMR